MYHSTLGLRVIKKKKKECGEDHDLTCNEEMNEGGIGETGGMRDEARYPKP